MTPESEAEKALILTFRKQFEGGFPSMKVYSDGRHEHPALETFLLTAYRKGCEKGREESIDASVPFGDAFHLGLETGRNRERAEILARLPKERKIDYSYQNVPEEWRADPDNVESYGWNAALEAVREAIGN